MTGVQRQKVEWRDIWSTCVGVHVVDGAHLNQNVMCDALQLAPHGARDALLGHQLGVGAVAEERRLAQRTHAFAVTDHPR